MKSITKIFKNYQKLINKDKENSKEELKKQLLNTGIKEKIMSIIDGKKIIYCKNCKERAEWRFNPLRKNNQPILFKVECGISSDWKSGCEFYKPKFNILKYLFKR